MMDVKWFFIGAFIASVFVASLLLLAQIFG